MTMKFSGDAFTAVRESRGMTIYRVAEDTGLSYPTVRAYEKKGACPSLDAAFRLAEILECDVTDFADFGEGAKPARVTVDPTAVPSIATRYGIDPGKLIDEYQALIQKRIDQKGELSPEDMDRLLALDIASTIRDEPFVPPEPEPNSPAYWSQPGKSIFSLSVPITAEDAPVVTDAERIVRQQYMEETAEKEDDEWEQIKKEQELEEAARAEQEAAL